MRRLMLAAAVGGLLAVLALRGQAGGDEVQAIIDKAVKAHHPKGINSKNTAYQGKNKGTIHVMGLDLEFTQEISLQSPPGKFKEVMDMSVMGVQVKSTTVYDGKEGWIKVSVNNMDKDIPVKDELLDEFKEMSYMMGLSNFQGLKAKDAKVSLIGDAQVNGKPAVGLRISKEGKKDISLYFDKETGLMVKTERRAKDFQGGQEVTEERIIQAYQDVAGQKMAKKVLVNRDGKKLLEAEVIESRFIEKLDDAEFAKP